ncbi:hypothetical protein LSAT2_032949 [Lamellibrachia satsuma]|nr:hypothetical protein LSAT2_032949 [Lamellibrachia satsuma]
MHRPPSSKSSPAHSSAQCDWVPAGEGKGKEGGEGGGEGGGGGGRGGAKGGRGGGAPPRPPQRAVAHLCGTSRPTRGRTHVRNIASNAWSHTCAEHRVQRAVAHTCGTSRPTRGRTHVRNIASNARSHTCAAHRVQRAVAHMCGTSRPMRGRTPVRIIASIAWSHTCAVDKTVRVSYVPSTEVTCSENPTEGRTVTLTCEVTDGKPRDVSKVTWKKDNTPLSPAGTTLTISSADHSTHDGFYSCAAKNVAETGDPSATFHLQINSHTFIIADRPKLSEDTFCKVSLLKAVICNLTQQGNWACELKWCSAHLLTYRRGVHGRSGEECLNHLRACCSQIQEMRCQQTVNAIHSYSLATLLVP